MSEIQIMYKSGKPLYGLFEGAPFALSFKSNAAGKGKGAWIGYTDSGFQIVHSGNYLVAVFPPDDNRHEVFQMNPYKYRTLNGVKTGILRP
jgi:hypothetical protein